MTHYETLDLERGCSQKEVVRSYRRQAMRWHPDRQETEEARVEAEERIKKINIAYAVLGDEIKRTAYDLTLPAVKKTAERTQSRPARPDRQASYEEFEELRKTLPRGRDVHQTVHLKVSEAVAGCDYLFDDPEAQKCDRCHGQGGNRHRCLQCHGKGTVQSTSGKVSCERCEGSGFRKVLCDHCHGSGFLGQSSRKLQIPKGVIDGSVIKFEGCGLASGCGGYPGDLLLTIKVELPYGWKSDGADLKGVIQVDAITAMLGGELDVHIPTGKTLRIAVPEWTDAGKKIRLSGHGLFDGSVGKAGDVYLKTIVCLPKKKSVPRHVRAALQEWVS